MYISFITIEATVKDLLINTTSCQLTSDQFEAAVLEGRLKSIRFYGQKIEICEINLQNNLLIERGGTIAVHGRNSLRLNVRRYRNFHLKGDIVMMGNTDLIGSIASKRWLGGYHNLYSLSSKGNINPLKVKTVVDTIFVVYNFKKPYRKLLSKLLTVMTFHAI